MKIGVRIDEELLVFDLVRILQERTCHPCSAHLLLQPSFNKNVVPGASAIKSGDVAIL